MSHQEVEDYFAQVPVWMKNDIGREIRLAHAARGEHRAVLEELDLVGGGNLLAALGLVAYTEALGLIRRWNHRRSYGRPEQCFLSFFDEMDGGSYRGWRIAWELKHRGTSLYEVLRCGLVHEYRPKVHSGFWMADGAPLGLDERDGRLIFKVGPYFRHFSEEADRLHQELRAMPDPEIPPPKFRGTVGTHRPPYRRITTDPSS